MPNVRLGYRDNKELKFLFPNFVQILALIENTKIQVDVRGNKVPEIVLGSGVEAFRSR
jgi:hypothetical protein